MHSFLIRLARLEALVAKGCPTCEQWSAGVYTVLVADDDLERVIEEPRPYVCPHCGRHAPPTIERTLVLVPADVLKGI